MADLVKDPVCGMMVAGDAFPLEYLEMHFSFCSQQCRERFSANPHLYIGVPGARAPKQEGLEILKRRRFALDQALSVSQATILNQALSSMMGIKKVQVSGDSVEVTYDLLEATSEQIESQLEGIGLQLGAGWSEKLRRGFVHYIEECEVDGLEVKPGAHGHHHG